MRKIPIEKEPIFGDGALPFVGQAIGLAVALVIVLGALLLGRFVFAEIRSTMFGEQQTAPIEGVTPNGVHWKRID